MILIEKELDNIHVNLWELHDSLLLSESTYVRIFINKKLRKM